MVSVLLVLFSISNHSFESSLNLAAFHLFFCNKQYKCYIHTYTYISSHLSLTDCAGLKSPQVVRHLRFQAHLLLEEATCEQRGRFGELLLILPPLQSVAWQMVETLHLAQLLGEARMDSLLQEMLLGEEAKVEQRLHPGRRQCYSIYF